MRIVISIDPGNQKCGLLLADLINLSVIDGKVVKKNYVIKLINQWKNIYSIDLIILGNGTTSQYWKSKLYSNNISPVKLVDEARTTLRARERYLELCPPKFPISLVPRPLLLPPSNLDAVVALILIEDFSNKQLKWKKPIEIRISP